MNMHIVKLLLALQHISYWGWMSLNKQMQKKVKNSRLVLTGHCSSLANSGEGGLIIDCCDSKLIHSMSLFLLKTLKYYTLNVRVKSKTFWKDLQVQLSCTVQSGTFGSRSPGLLECSQDSSHYVWQGAEGLSGLETTDSWVTRHAL